MIVDKTKILYLDTVFTKELDTSGDIVSINIEGYASTNDIDRSGDVVSASVWEKGLENYIKNPIILAYHDYTKPVGRMIEHKLDKKGLWIKARISAAAEDVFNLVKDGVMTAFSIGFRVLDAEYNQAAEVFLIKEIELHEISVVPVPCNQNTLFSLSKAFETAEDYNSYRMLFASKDAQAKQLETSLDSNNSNHKKEWNMTPEEMQARIEEAASKAASAAIAQVEKARAEAEAASKAKAASEAEMDARIKAAVAAVTPSETGAEKLLADIEKRMDEQNASSKKSIEDLLTVVKEKTAELDAIQKSKMSFSDKGGRDLDYAEKEKAVMLAKVTGKSIENTKFGAALVQKVGPHQASATWELEVSLRMEEEVRRRLVVSPLLRQVAMNTNVMTMPLNPEAGYGTWVTNAQFGTTDSSGATVVHQLSEITLNAYKLATREYMNYEEEEDSLIILMPIVRDAMIRRVAKSVDKAFLLGAGAGADPVKGLAIYDATSAVTSAVANKATVANMIAMRRDLGAWGLDPSEVTYVVSTDIYYDLLEDTNFQTVDKIGDRATLLTGQIGSIANSPVLVSAQFPSKASGTTSGTVNIGAVAFNTGNFIVGNQRGLRMDTQDLVESQKKVLVASLRTGMTKLTANLGDAVSTFRWIA
jgi:HK97 family phage prohead protease/HK97 family phage major capsid protein